MQTLRHWILAVGATALTVWGVASLGAQQPVNPRAAALRVFADRTRAYVELRDRVDADLQHPGTSASVEAVRDHQRQLALGIRRARRSAKAGDIFTPPVVPQFRAIVRRDLRERDVRDAMAALQEVPPIAAIRVNDLYPEQAARATVPPRLLVNLHQLPPGLEYRFLGRHLVLVDIEANLVVDFIKNAVPSVLRGR